MKNENAKKKKIFKYYQYPMETKLEFRLNFQRPGFCCNFCKKSLELCVSNNLKHDNFNFCEILKLLVLLDEACISCW